MEAPAASAGERGGPREHRKGPLMRLPCLMFAVALALGMPYAASSQNRVQSSDLLKLRAVNTVQLSPDGTRVAYVVDNNDGPGRPYGQISVMTRVDGKSGLAIAKPDGTGARFLAEMTGTNAPLPGIGTSVAWSPDGKRIAFVSSVPGPETADANGDPMVITRYLYKPDAAEGLTHFNDNRRLHLFVVEIGRA